MSNKLKSALHFLLHITFFVLVEIVIAFVIFREFPSIDIFGATGVMHLIYRCIIVITGILRNRFTKVYQRFILTYSPVIFHIAGHLWLIEMFFGEMEEHAGHEENYTILILSVIIFGFVIFGGEYLIHRYTHCEHEHGDFHHKHCE